MPLPGIAGIPGGFQFWILIDSARLEIHTTGERRTGMRPSTVVGRVFLNRFVFFFFRGNLSIKRVCCSASFSWT